MILRLDPTLTPAHQEHLIAITGSLAEALIEQGYEVGLLAAGTHLRPALGPAQAWAMLLALAKLDVLQPLPHDRLDQGASRVVLGGFARGQGDADVFLHIPPPVEKPTEAA
ncbi:MAG: hypothetical protein R3C68_15645 [Myxococcota bacterium]